MKPVLVLVLVMVALVSDPATYRMFKVVDHKVPNDLEELLVFPLSHFPHIITVKERLVPTNSGLNVGMCGVEFDLSTSRSMKTVLLFYLYECLYKSLLSLVLLHSIRLIQGQLQIS